MSSDLTEEFHVATNEEHVARLLFEAIENTEIAQMRSMLSSGSEFVEEASLLNYFTDSGETLLHRAVLSGMREFLVPLLQQAPGLVNLPNRKGETPLHVALRRNFTIGASCLLEFKADPLLPDLAGISPIQIAVRMESSIVLEMIWEGHADLLSHEKQLELLREAFISKSHEVALFLFRTLKPSPTLMLGKSSVLQLAAQTGLRSLLEHVITSDNEIEDHLDFSDEDGRTSLHYAVLSGSATVVSELADCGANIEQTDLAGDTPIMLAAQLGHADAFMALFRLNPNMEGPAEKTDTNRFDVIHTAIAFNRMPAAFFQTFWSSIPPHAGDILCFAAQYDNVAAASALLALGVSANSSSAKRMTPLAYAARNGSVAMTRMLLRQGADASHVCQDGKSVLMIAAIHSPPELVQLLLDAGVDCSRLDRRSRSALSFALEGDRCETVKLLARSCSIREAEILQSIRACPLCFETVFDRLYTQKSIDIDTLFTDHIDEPLSLAAITCHEGLPAQLQFLLNKGANPVWRTRDHRTLLHIAALSGSLECAKVLVKHGADPCHIDSTSRAPLDHVNRLTHPQLFSFLYQSMNLVS